MMKLFLYFVSMLIVMVITHFHILQDSNSIIGEGCQGEIFGEQIRGNAKLVQCHQTSTERGSDLTGDTTLVKSDNALILLSHADKNNLRGTYAATRQVLSFHLHLV